MARGYYEMPQGRPGSVYGPPRPRQSPLNSAKNSPSSSPTNGNNPSSTLPTATRHTSNTTSEFCRRRVLILASLISSETVVDDMLPVFRKLGEVEVAKTLASAVNALSMNPDVVMVADPSNFRASWSGLSPALVEYSAGGGRVVTQTADLQSALKTWFASRSEQADP